MSASNGVIRVGRKGRKKFAFGEEGTPGSEPFEVDVVEVFHNWLAIDDNFRSKYEEDTAGNRVIPQSDLFDFHALLIRFIESQQGIDVTKEDYKPNLSKAEALDFLARLKESYDELVHFFRPKSQAKQESQSSSEPQSQTVFSEEPVPS